MLSFIFKITYSVQCDVTGSLEPITRDSEHGAGWMATNQSHKTQELSLTNILQVIWKCQLAYPGCIWIVEEIYRAVGKTCVHQSHRPEVGIKPIP